MQAQLYGGAFPAHVAIQRQILGRCALPFTPLQARHATEADA
jgi:hypothetical protein